MADALSLLPAPCVLPRLVRRGDLPPGEWVGMQLDGVLVALTDDVAVTTERPPEPGDRAQALAPALPRHGVLGRDAAAWVHAGGRAPARACVLVPVGVRRPDARPDRASAETVFAQGDVVVVAGVPVTSPVRTGADVARWVEGAAAVERLVALASCGVDLQEVRARLAAMTGRRHVRRAFGALEDASERVASLGVARGEPQRSASSGRAPVMR
ncbi:hypothetical protein [Cellulomonas sp. PSBB021]|uniref:hypothetical protein n=1 Tax=Cellulomonas sp. PSBB021 TaxID=2003551 RepID=UPI000B8D811C|nr:hypothetical protein [Cellulomonas sp. PSBB021]ASR54621.1 hypothetical protein CBP52_05230 [Cellulomonas sp. PSBB021]